MVTATALYPLATLALAFMILKKSHTRKQAAGNFSLCICARR
jgi:hypothetical protein